MYCLLTNQNLGIISENSKETSCSEEESSEESEKEPESKESKSAEILTKTDDISESEKVGVEEEVQPGPSSS
jgi:hypothetical protein